MTRKAGRPHPSLNLTPTKEIARRLNIPQRTIERTLSTALNKLSASGQLEQLFSLAQHGGAERGSDIRCGSIECRPEKWVFFN
jgi:hypothetical protein